MHFVLTWSVWDIIGVAGVVLLLLCIAYLAIEDAVVRYLSPPKPGSATYHRRTGTTEQGTHDY